MKQFYAFYNSNFDAKMQAQTDVHAHAINKTVSTHVVDTNSNDGALQYWDKSCTIQCVTLDDAGTFKNRKCSPVLAEIDAMIDNL